MTAADFDEVQQAISSRRLARYVGWAGGDRTRALELYALNVRLSEALYTPIQFLEVTLRNRVHATMTECLGERWFETEEVLVHHQREQVASARLDLEKDGKPVSPDQMVARLTLSFWTAMLGPTYEALWRKALSAIAIKDNGRRLARKQLSGPLTPIRILRNRIAHHEPILHWNLCKHHHAIHEITIWLSPDTARWCAAIDRFQSVMPAEGYALASAEAETI